MPAFLHCYCRLFVNPLKHRLARQPEQPTPDCPTPTDTRVLEPSRSGESCLRAERRRREHVILCVLRAVPGPSWGPSWLALPTVIEQFDALMQGDKCCFSRDTHRLQCPTRRSVESDVQTCELATRISSRSFIPALPGLGGHGSSHECTQAVRRATTPHHPDRTSFLCLANRPRECHNLVVYVARQRGYWAWSLTGRHGRFRESVSPTAEMPRQPHTVVLVDIDAHGSLAVTACRSSSNDPGASLAPSVCCAGTAKPYANEAYRLASCLPRGSTGPAGPPGNSRMWDFLP